MSGKRFYPQTIQISATVEFELPPPKNGQRAALVIQNQDANAIYVNEDTHADATSTQLGGLQTATYDDTTGVPQGKVWLKGSQAALQRVLVKQAVDV